MRPIARDCDEESSIPQDFLDGIWELGLTSTGLPEKHGGGGEPRSPVTNAILLEELGYGDATLALAAMAPSAFANAIVDHGTKDQQEKLLPLFCDGDLPTQRRSQLSSLGPCSTPRSPARLPSPRVMPSCCRGSSPSFPWVTAPAISWWSPPAERDSTPSSSPGRPRRPHHLRAREEPRAARSHHRLARARAGGGSAGGSPGRRGRL